MTSSLRSPPAPAGRPGPRWTLLPDRIPTTGWWCSTGRPASLHFPPAVREPDGSLRSYGAVPPAGSPIRVPQLQHGRRPAGKRCRPGSLRAAVLYSLRQQRGEPPRPPMAALQAETIEQAKERGPLALRTRDRAITAEDYEQLAKRAAPDIARVRCIPARRPRGGRWREDPGGSGRRSGQGQPADVP